MRPGSTPRRKVRRGWIEGFARAWIEGEVPTSLGQPLELDVEVGDGENKSLERIGTTDTERPRLVAHFDAALEPAAVGEGLGPEDSDDEG